MLTSNSNIEASLGAVRFSVGITNTPLSLSVSLSLSFVPLNDLIEGMMVHHTFKIIVLLCIYIMCKFHSEAIDGCI